MPTDPSQTSDEAVEGAGSVTETEAPPVDAPASAAEGSAQPAESPAPPAEGPAPPGEGPARPAGGPAPAVEPLPAAGSSFPTSTPLHARLATPDDLEGWDARAVASKTGHVYQSRAWGEYRAAHGWRTWNILFDDGFPLLVVARDRPVVGGGSAYASRGPIPDADVALTAQRAAAAAELLAAEGIDALTVDGETPASAGLAPLLKAAGFEPTEEVQPSRHRMDVHLGPDDSPNSDESTIFSSFGATTRNLIRQADRHGLRVLRLDVGGGRAEGEYTGPPLEGFEPLDPEDAAGVEQRLKAFYGMLDATAERRGFALASEAAFLDWSKRSLAAGHSFYLEAVHDEDGPVAGASFLRHGDRLTYSLAGDRAELRRKYPGVVRLLVWRGIQVALDERRTTVDLGGIDTAADRGKPDKGDPTYGMYQFKESFGARWVEMTGAHQRTMRPLRSLAGRVAGRLASLRR